MQNSLGIDSKTSETRTIDPDEKQGPESEEGPQTRISVGLMFDQFTKTVTRSSNAWTLEKLY